MNMQMPPPQIGAASRWRVWLVGGVVLAALVGGYWYFGQDSAPVRKRSTVIPVKVGLVERRDMAVVEHTLGSVVLGLALAEGRLDAPAAHALGALDELFQAEQWGDDAEAVARRAAIAADIALAAQFIALSKEQPV